MNRILKAVKAADLSDAEQELLMTLQQTNNLLDVQPLLATIQEISDQESTATVPQTDSGNPRNLKWSDCIHRMTTTTAYNIAISKDERLLAVEHDWDITIHSLPSMEIVREIIAPDELHHAIVFGRPILPRSDFLLTLRPYLCPG